MHSGNLQEFQSFFKEREKSFIFPKETFKKNTNTNTNIKNEQLIFFIFIFKIKSQNFYF